MKQTEKYKMNFGKSVVNGIDYIKERDKFLKSKKVLTRFKKLEYEEGIGYPDVRNARELVNSFFWDETSEGYSYWHKLNIEWLEHIGIFGKYATLNDFELALEKVKVFKCLLKELGDDTYSNFSYAFNTDNEQLSLFINDTLIRTFLAGYANSDVLKIWLDDYHLIQDYWKSILRKIEDIDFLMYEMESNLTFKSSLLRRVPYENIIQSQKRKEYCGNVDIDFCEIDSMIGSDKEDK